MALYLMLSKLTERGRARVKSAPDRIREVNDEVEEKGVAVQVYSRQDAVPAKGRKANRRSSRLSAPPCHRLPQSILDDSSQRPALLYRSLLKLGKELVVQADGSSHAQKHTPRAS